MKITLALFVSIMNKNNETKTDGESGNGGGVRGRAAVLITPAL